MKNKLLKKFLTFSYGSLLGAAITFLTTMVSTRVLPPEEFGKASMFLLFVSVGMIISVFGTDQAFVRFFFEEQENKRGALLFNCLKVSFIIMIPVILVIILFREKILQFLFSDYNTWIFVALIIAVIMQVFYRFGTLVIRMQQMGNTYSILEVINKLLILIGVIVFYNIIGSSYEILIFSTVISFMFLFIFLIFSQKKYWSLNNIGISNMKHSKTEIFSYGYPLAFTTVVMWVFEGSDKFAIREWSDFNELGLYAAAFKIIGLLAILKIAFTTFWTPVAYEAYQNDPTNTSFFANISKLVSFVMILVGVVVIMLKDIVIKLLGGGYEESSLMLSFLVFLPIMYTISETTMLGINFQKKVKWHVVIASVVCIVNIIGNWLLVPQFGGIGASISTGLSFILFFTLRTFISLYYYKVNYGLTKVYTSTVVLVFFASYTFFPSQPIHEQIVGVMAIIIIIFIYLNDIKRVIKLRKEVVQ